MDFDESIQKLEQWFTETAYGFIGGKTVNKTVLNWLAYFYSLYGTNQNAADLYAKLFYIFSGMFRLSDDKAQFEKYFLSRIIEQIDKKFYMPPPKPPVEENNNNPYKPGDN